MLQTLSGPCFVASLLIFFVGLLGRAVWYVRGLDWRLERVAYGYHKDRSIPGAINSIAKWLLPGGTTGWRAQPVAMLAFFLLHFGAVLIPLFLLGHTVLLEQTTGICLPSLPPNVADILCIASLSGIALLVLRRLFSPTLRQLNTWKDWFVLLLTFLPFFTGCAFSLPSVGPPEVEVTVTVCFRSRSASLRTCRVSSICTVFSRMEVVISSNISKPSWR